MTANYDAHLAAQTERYFDRLDRGDDDDEIDPDLDDPDLDNAEDLL